MSPGRHGRSARPDLGSSAFDAKKVAALARKGRDTRYAPDDDDVEAQLALQHLRGRNQDLRFRTVYGWTLLALLVLQVLGANAVFVIYAVARSWELDTGAIQTWMAATVVEVIGLAWVVVRSVFPPDPPPPGR